MWTAYLALEPYVRRNWPTTLISWTSLLAGRVTDPIVGRDVLIGMLAGLVLKVLGQAANGWFSTQPHMLTIDVLMGLRANLGVLLQELGREPTSLADYVRHRRHRWSPVARTNSPDASSAEGEADPPRPA